MPYSRIYLDSNIFIRAFESPKEDTTARLLVELLGEGQRVGGPVFSTSQISLGEVLVHPIRDSDDRLRRRYEQLMSVSSTWLKVVPVSRQALVHTAELRATRRLKLPDAIHLSAAITTNCSHLLSRDTDFKTVDGATPDPVVLRPIDENLESLLAWLRT